MKYIDFVDLSYSPRDTDLIAEFKVVPGGIGMEEAAGAIAAESSIGTWTELTTVEPYVKRLSARVFRIDGDLVSIAYPIELFEPGNMPNILSSVAGNVFGLRELKRLRLIDVHFPEAMVKSFPGPRFGVEGVRDLLRVRGRPLLGTIIKPKLGLMARDHARVAYEAWLGGCDMVKDDENLAGQGFNPFEERVSKTLEMRERAEEETGERKVYMVNVTAEAGEMLRRAEYVEEAGGEYVMVDILTCGFSALQSLRRNFSLVIHGHRAGHAALTRLEDHGIAMKVLAKASRLVGVDQLHVGSVVGKMSDPEEEVLENIKAIREPMHGLRPILPVASGGIHPALVPKLLKLFGVDLVIQAGGGIHGHPLGTLAGARAMRQAVEATVEGYSLEEYAMRHEELSIALKTWPG